MADEELIFSYVGERDVDFMLVEEFRCSSTFVRWFLEQILPSNDREWAQSLNLLKVLHSVVTTGPGSGESDIMLVFGSDARHELRVLIENKIDAVFQEDQGPRYRARVRQIVANQEADRALCVLVAPNEYAENSPHAQCFDAIVTYEEIREYFHRQAGGNVRECVGRYQHRRDLLDYAIGKYRRGYAPVPSPETTRVWEVYYRQACKIAPQLKLSQPGPKPAQSSFIRFADALQQSPSLPGAVIKHKLPYGNVDLEIAGWGSFREAFTQTLQEVLEPQMTLRLAGKSLAINITVPTFDLAGDPERQIDIIDQGLRAAVQLKSWYDRHLAVFEKCAELAGRTSHT